MMLDFQSWGSGDMCTGPSGFAELEQLLVESKVSVVDIYISALHTTSM